MNAEDNFKESEVETLYRNNNHFWFRHRNKIILDIIEKYLKEAKDGIRILELGAGSGNISRFLKSKGYNVDASDVYKTAIDYFKNDVDNAFVFDLLSDKAPDNMSHRYDFVILGDVLEHLDDPVSALERTKVFLRPKGYIVITVPALMQLWGDYDEYYGHKRRYNKKSLENELIESGYSLEEIKYFMFLPSLFLFFQRKVKPIARGKSRTIFKELNINDFLNRIMHVLMLIEYVVGKTVDYSFGSSILLIGKNQ